MKIGNPIIMCDQITPDFHSMFVAAVKCPVNEFHLRNLMVQEKLQFFFYQIKIPESQFLINGGKTITTGKWTPSAGFIIDNPVFKVFQIFINKRNLTQIHDIAPT